MTVGGVFGVVVSVDTNECGGVAVFRAMPGVGVNEGADDDLCSVVLELLDFDFSELRRTWQKVCWM